MSHPIDARDRQKQGIRQRDMLHVCVKNKTNTRATAYNIDEKITQILPNTGKHIKLTQSIRNLMF